MNASREPTSLSTTGSQLADVLEAYLEDVQEGKRPLPESLLAAHPELGEDLQTCLASLEFIRQAAPLGAEANRDEQAEIAGEPLGDFRLIRELGRGGMGVVYEAEQLSLGRRVAVKVLPFAAVLDRRQLQRFKNEAQAAALLKHPHIVPVYYVGCDRGVHYYVMELVEGMSLADTLRRLRHERGITSEAEGDRERSSMTPPGGWAKSFSENLAAASTVRAAGREETKRSSAFGGDSGNRSEYFRAVARLGIQAATALEYAHQLGVVHRDIKPSNLLVDDTGHLWVSDFGLAMTQTDAKLTISGDILGTLRYMSPEQASGRRVLLDQRTDIYSLGITLYELLTLRPAFGEGGREHVLRQIAEVEPPNPRKFNKGIPKDLETIVLKATAKDREARYARVAELSLDLQSFLEQKPIQARRSGPLEHLRHWARRNRLLAGLLVALFVCLPTGTIVSTYFALAARDRAHEAQESAAEAERNAEQAKQNFRHAQQVVDQFLTRVSQSPELLCGAPGTQQLRRELLQLARDYYQGFIAQLPDDLALEHELATAHMRLAAVLQQLGDFPTAVAAYDEAIDIYQRLAEQNPGAWEVALEACERCIELQKALLEKDPSAEKRRSELGECYYNLGVIQAALTNDKKSQEAYRKANEVLTRPDDNSSSGGRGALILSLAHTNLGVLHKQDG